jgi:hypothetical protein
MMDRSRRTGDQRAMRAIVIVAGWLCVFAIGGALGIALFEALEATRFQSA